MRGADYYHTEEVEEEETAFVTMTDMTVSILFILLILLAFFASQLRPEGVKSEEIIEGLNAQLEVLKDENVELKALLSDQDIDFATLSETKSRLEAANRRLAELERILSEQEDIEAELLQALANTDLLEKQLEEFSENRLDRLEIYNSAVRDTRVGLLQTLKSQIDAEYPELRVRLSATEDALQFVGEGLFASGNRSLSASSTVKVRRIAEILENSLSCYTIGSRSAFAQECNEGYALIDALQIEGHTDSDGTLSFNTRLGADRAAATYGAMVEHLPGLTDHRNLASQPVLSVAGYGEDRPVAPNDTNENKSLNRRIDLRFIMLRPSSVEEIDEIKSVLQTYAPGRNDP